MLKMKINMAEGDYFNIGMVVSCTTCHGQILSGEVMSYDHSSKLLSISIFLYMIIVLNTLVSVILFHRTCHKI